MRGVSWLPQMRPTVFGTQFDALHVFTNTRDFVTICAALLAVSVDWVLIHSKYGAEAEIRNILANDEIWRQGPL